ncbi:hypothetical protein ACFYST_33420 [Kitasatospora sp. NPDC004614]|uniref:hypothetical protein n=1 Tax=unclassified Kitasatospora TaxID=2633591 RepID=UPI003693B6ED
MARTKPRVLIALAALGVLAAGAATAAVAGAVDKPAGKPAIAAPDTPAAGDRSAQARYDQVVSDFVDVAGSHGSAFATATCPPGEVPIGGGAATSDIDIFLTDSHPNGDSWIVAGTNTSSQTESIRAFAVCTTP